jgi:CheY-like chemotaxis protein
MTFIFLDIEMPELSGWDVLEEFHTFPQVVKDQFEIFILSSFIYTKRKPDSVLGEYIAGYIAKPLTKFILQETIQQKHEFFV